VADPTERTFAWLVGLTGHRRRTVRFAARAALVLVVGFVVFVGFVVGSAKLEENKDAAARFWTPVIQLFQVSPSWWAEHAEVVSRVALFGVLLVGAVIVVKLFWSSTGRALRKIRARLLALTGEIAAWHAAMKLTEPALIRSGPDAHTNMMADYSTRFGARVIAARNELAALGYTDAQLDSYYEHPTNLIGVRIVHERLGALALRLPGGKG